MVTDEVPVLVGPLVIWGVGGGVRGEWTLLGVISASSSSLLRYSSIV